MAGVGVGQILVWRRQQRLVPVTTRASGGRSGTVLFSTGDVLNLGDWSRRSISEKQAARLLRLLPTTVRALAEAGELGECRQYGNLHEYEREGVERYMEYRSRLLSMRATSREYGISWFILRRLIDRGSLPVAGHGAKGSCLIDPHDLKPLLESVPCEVCGDLLPPGWESHWPCLQKTPEFRQSARRWISDWWASPESAPFREKIAELPCPECGHPVRLPEPTLRKRANRNQTPSRVPAETPRVFCNKSCSGKYRWRKGIGLDGVVEGLNGRARRKLKGRWTGHRGASHGSQGASHGIHGASGGHKGGRTPAASPEQRAQMHEMLQKGFDSRTIALEVFGDARLKERVLRYRRREFATKLGS